MLTAIENLHIKGYIHRDIKPSNFVIGRGTQRKKVFMVDFGLAKLHMHKGGKPLEERKNADYRGTITYASLNAHWKKDLSRRDDLWSLFFVILEFLNEPLPWRDYNSKDEVRDIKQQCVDNAPLYLFRGPTKKLTPVHEIFHHLQSLSYEDEPNYELVRSCLVKIQKNSDISTATATFTEVPELLLQHPHYRPPQLINEAPLQVEQPFPSMFKLFPAKREAPHPPAMLPDQWGFKSPFERDLEPPPKVQKLDPVHLGMPFPPRGMPHHHLENPNFFEYNPYMMQTDKKLIGYA